MILFPLLHTMYAAVFWIKIFTESFVNVIRKCTVGFPRAKLPEHLEGKVAIITGANRGIGFETAKTFAKLGATVIMACRNMEAANNALKQIREEIDPKYVDNVTASHLDLGSFDSVHKFADKMRLMVNQIDYLINNGGIMMCDQAKTKDGFESQLGINYLSHFLLTNLLLSRMNKSAQARIVNMTSISHNAYIINFKNINLLGIYTRVRAYGQSKLATILFTRELTKKLSHTKITSYAVDPGLVCTDLYANSDNAFARFTYKYFGNLSMISPELGSQTVLYCALDPSLDKESGHYYHHCKRVDNLIKRVNDEDAEELWLLSSQLCGLDV